MALKSKKSCSAPTESSPARKPGSLIIDMSSISPLVSQKIAAACEAKGVDFLDAPVSGGEPKAIEGTLAIMVGGKPEVFAKAEPILKCLGSSVTLTGPVGAGNTTKLANQIMVACNIAAMGEALTLATRCGLNPEVVVNAVKAGLAGSAVLNAKGPMLIARNFKPGFKISLHQKDLRNALETAEANNVSCRSPPKCSRCSPLSSPMAKATSIIPPSPPLSRTPRTSKSKCRLHSAPYPASARRLNPQHVALFSFRLHFPGSSISSPLSAFRTTARPAAPSPPPSNPYGRNFLRSASSVTSASLSNSTSRTSPSPPQNFPSPPEPSRYAYRRTRNGYAYSSASTGVFSEFVICVCTPLIPSIPGRAPIPPAAVS